MKYKKKLHNKLYRFYKNRLDYHNSKNEKIDNIDTIIFGFGPLRNFTTLLASIFSLHPEVQVLNHGGRRVFRQKKLNFLYPEFSGK